MISFREMKFFDIARTMAKLSTWSEEPREQIGAIIVIRNEVVAAGYNRRKTSTMQAYWAEKAGRPEAIYTHAEMSCLQKINTRDTHLAKLFVFRETKNGLGMARPCEICSLAIREFKIKHIYYTTDHGHAYEKWEI